MTLKKMGVAKPRIPTSMTLKKKRPPEGQQWKRKPAHVMKRKTRRVTIQPVGKPIRLGGR